MGFGGRPETLCGVWKPERRSVNKRRHVLACREWAHCAKQGGTAGISCPGIGAGFFFGKEHGNETTGQAMADGGQRDNLNPTAKKGAIYDTDPL